MLLDLDVVPVATGVARGLLPVRTPLFGRLRILHFRAELTKDAAPVNGTLKTAQRAIDGLVVSDSDTYGQGKLLFAVDDEGTLRLR